MPPTPDIPRPDSFEEGKRLSPDQGPLVLIVNPVAGAGRGTQLAGKVRHLWSAAGYQVEVQVTDAPGQATTLARVACQQEGVQALFALGGDGTVHEVACGLLGSQVPLGIIPLGSGNGLARHLGYGAWTQRDPSQLSTTWMDVGLANGAPFFVTCGLGLEGAVAHAFAQSHLRGLFTYGRLALRLIRDARPFAVTITLNGYNVVPDGLRHLTLEAVSVTMANAGQWGNNCWVAPHATLYDGLLDLVCLRPGPLRRHLRSLLRMYRRAPVGDRAALYGQVTGARIESAVPNHFHLDGEPAGQTSVVELSLTPKSLMVLAPLPFT